MITKSDLNLINLLLEKFDEPIQLEFDIDGTVMFKDCDNVTIYTEFTNKDSQIELIEFVYVLIKGI